jgi:Tfp pilus assembly protein PilE
MLKNNKGVTLTMLVITIIVILILASTTITASTLLIRDTKAKTLASNMILLQGKVEELYEKYDFMGDESILVGEKYTNSLSSYGITEEDYTEADDVNFWYSLDEDNLTNLGFDKDMLDNGAKYIVNYKTSEVIYTLGVEVESGNRKYKLSDIINR